MKETGRQNLGASKEELRSPIGRVVFVWVVGGAGKLGNDGRPHGPGNFVPVCPIFFVICSYCGRGVASRGGKGTFFCGRRVPSPGGGQTRGKTASIPWGDFTTGKKGADPGVFSGWQLLGAGGWNPPLPQPPPPPPWRGWLRTEGTMMKQRRGVSLLRGRGGLEKRPTQQKVIPLHLQVNSLSQMKSQAAVFFGTQLPEGGLLLGPWGIGWVVKRLKERWPMELLVGQTGVAQYKGTGHH